MSKRIPPISGKRQREESPGTSGHSSEESSNDDTVGHMNPRLGQSLCDRYTVVRELGVGTFGKVYECSDSKHKDTVAIKVVRKIKRYISSAKIEAKILSELYQMQKLNKSSYIVKLYSHFSFEGYFCMVFEPLGESLYEFIKKYDHQGLPIDCTLQIAQQMLGGVSFLHKMDLIHTDLKLENVLLVRSEATRRTYDDGSTVYIPEQCKIKLIDFGGATYNNDSKSTCVNTRQYRGPEVILELGWSFPSDIWSVGCIIAEVYTGELLFATHNNLEHLALIERAAGSFPRLFCKSPLFRKYFHSTDGSVRVDELSRSSRTHVEKMQDVAKLFWRRAEDRDSHAGQLLSNLLRVNPVERITAANALEIYFPGL